MARNTIQDIPFKFPMDEAQVELLFQSCLEDKLDEIISGKKAAEEKSKELDAKIKENETLIREKDALIQQRKMQIQEKDALIQQGNMQIRELEKELERLRLLARKHGLGSAVTTE